MRLVLFLFLFLPITVWSQIVGHINDYAFHSIELIELSDVITKSYHTIETDTILIDGSFQFEKTPNKAGLYFIRIKNKFVNLVLEPGVSYSIDLSAPKYKQVLSEQIQVNSFEADGKKQKYLHEIALELDKTLNEFARDASEELNDSIRLSMVDSMQKSLTASYETPSNQYPWLKNEIQNRFSMIAFTLTGKHKYIDSVFSSNFNPQSQSYFQVFQAYTNPLYAKWKLENQDSIISVLPDSNVIEPLLSEFKSILPKNSPDSLVEYALLYQFYDFPFLKKKKLERVYWLRELKSFSNFKSVKYGCKKAINNLTKLMEKTVAPDITIWDFHKSELELDKLKGRFVYLQFWSMNNTASLLDLMLIESMHKKYGREISFVSINIDGDTARLKQYINNHKYKWIVGFVKDADKVKEQYNIQTTPMYYLLDTEGNLFKSPADRPERMYDLFDKIKAAEVSSFKPYEIIQTYGGDE